MTVEELTERLTTYLNEDKENRYYTNLYISDGEDIEDVAIDCVHYRAGEVLLRSNETDNGSWCLTIPYIIHCLKYFPNKMNVCVQVNDGILDYDYFDTDDTYIDEKDEFIIECSFRKTGCYVFR